MKRKNTKFLRAGYWEYSKLGLRRKNKLKYRRAQGIDNKVRLRMKGHLRNVSIGFRNEKQERHLLNGLAPVDVMNMEDMKKVGKNEIVVIGSIGGRKKFELMEYALQHNIKVYNINPKRFVEETKKEMEKRKEEKAKKEERKKGKEKRAKESEKKKEEKTEDKNKENKEDHKKIAEEHKHHESTK